MAVRISNTIRAELDVPIDNVIFWTDSLTVLQCRWWSGPEFLRDSQEHWPHRDVGDVAEDNKEAITLKVSQNALTVATGSSLDELMRRFSSWPQLVRSITWLIRFVHFVKSKRSVPPTVNHGKIGLAETRCFQGHSKDSPAAVLPRGFGGLRVW
ncbi:uncharacterized protein LOC141892792 [Acropora palmata]|uniref:uncharacterized protein LOC141892784 n=1 Tax=Acropora palmata TaxID=6131 RepID=UPI003D9FD79F